jgi:peptidoglycan/xylan/chitin deacetylase (PgdA/CDA1 family)
MDSGAWAQLRDMNVRTVLWDVDSRDWTRPGAKKIVKSVTRDVRPGSVVLFHDGGGERGQTIKSLGPIIRKLKREGYTFVTVEELWDINADAAKRKKDAKKALQQRTEAPNEPQAPDSTSG